MSTTPHVVPHARPLLTPPFACHPAHAVPHAGRRTRGTRKVGRAGVLHAGRHGIVLTCNAGGALLPFGPGSHVALGFCAAPLHAHGGKWVRGAFPRSPFAWHPHTQKEGGVPRRLCAP